MEMVKNCIRAKVFKYSNNIFDDLEGETGLTIVGQILENPPIVGWYGKERLVNGSS